MQRISPKAVARGAIAAAVAAIVAWISIASWPALLPFAIGGVIAYVVLPVVNVLDRILPRVLAALIGVVAFLAALVGILVIVLPPLATGIGALVSELPSRQEIAAWIEDLEATLAAQPGDIGPQLATMLDQLVAAVRQGLEQSGDSLGTIGLALVQGVVGAIATVIGLFVLPTWVLSAVSEQRIARRTLYSMMPAWLRDDAWAMVRIVDRAASTYVRGLVPYGVVVGVTMWLGLEGLEQLGVASFRDPAPIAVFAGAMQVIPELGPLIGFVPVVLLLPLSVERAVQYLVVYIASRWIASLILSRRETGRRRLHPLVLVPAIVALTQFGLIWLFLAGPVLMIGFDLVRYAHGRLSDPSRPAGVIPDEPLSPQQTAAAAQAAATPQRRVVTANG